MPKASTAVIVTLKAVPAVCVAGVGTENDAAAAAIMVTVVVALVPIPVADAVIVGVPARVSE